MNISIDIYNQSTKIRTYSFCKILNDSQNNVPCLIKTLHDTLFKYRIYDASNNGIKPREKKAKTLYTYENIEANLTQDDPLARISRKDIVVADALYRDTLKTIFQYFRTNQVACYDR